MKKYFSIGEAAKAVNTTSETLRHYDRIGLVKPSKKDEWTNYRYYTEQDIVRLNTVLALQLMDLPLKEIKKVLEYDDLEKIVEFFERAEKRADEKIAALQYSKSKIQLAKADSEQKLQKRKNPTGVFVKEIPERVILLSDTLQAPTLDNLWNYLSHFYEKVTPSRKDQFAFEDLAGVYREGTSARYFAVCTRYAPIEGLKTLPAGTYLCADCAEADWRKTLDRLLGQARAQYGAAADFSLQLVVVSGILQWKYQMQVYAGPQPPTGSGTT